MPINDKYPEAKPNRAKSGNKESCSELHISRTDLKRKNYINSKTVEMKKEWQCNRQERAVATVLLLNQMWKERQNFCQQEEGEQ